jgi:hypothetical protein
MVLMGTISVYIMFVIVTLDNYYAHRHYII